MQSAPRLFIVSGARGSGTTTLARRLSQDLASPPLAKDPMEEAIAGISSLIVDTTEEMTPPYAVIRDFAALPSPRLRT